MTIDAFIDFNARLVTAVCKDSVTIKELQDYQDQIWASGVAAGLNCLFDMRNANFSQINFSNILPLAAKAAMIDYGQSKSKLAVIVSSSSQEIISHFYQAAVEVYPSRTTRIMRTYYSLEDGLKWISKSSIETGQNENILSYISDKI